MIVREMVEGRKQSIESRLDQGLPDDTSQPMFSAKNIKYELSERTHAITHGGIGLFHELARQKECQIVEGHMVQDHVHMMINIPPKYSVAQIIGYLKGKSAIAVARQFGGRQRNFNGEKFWARGYAVSTVGFEKEQVRRYIRDQERNDGDDDNDNGGKF